MSMSRVPSFLLGGINLTYNFLGQRTARSAIYGVTECSIKLIPVIMLISAPAYMKSKQNAAELVVADASGEPVAQRRTSLEQ